MGDSRRVVEVWNRLLDNAGKFSEPDTAVEVRADVIDGQVVVDVVDQGLGIAAKDLETMFEPFLQVGHDQMVNRRMAPVSA